MLGSDGEFELTEAIGNLTFRIGVRTLLGADLLPHTEEIRSLIGVLTKGDSHHILRRIRALFPSMSKAQARSRLHELIAPALEGRRQGRAPASHNNLRTLLETTPPDGRAFTDEDICDLALGLIWGGHATMWGQLSWAIVLALQNQAWLGELREQTRGLSADDMSNVPAVEWTVLEAERLRPPVLVIGSLTVEPYEIDGFRVEKGWQTLISPAVAQRDPKVFSDPDSFDPTRFGPGREEHRQPYALIGFGGRHRRCIGEQFAKLEIKLALGTLLSRFGLELADGEPEPLAGPHPNRPKSPVMIRYRRR